MNASEIRARFYRLDALAEALKLKHPKPWPDGIEPRMVQRIRLEKEKLARQMIAHQR